MTDKFTLGILEAGQNRPEFVPEHGDYADWFDRALTAKGDRPFELRRYASHAGVLPGSAEECDGYLITGSRFSVLEHADWMEATKTFVTEASASRPVVGICFGHQLIAEAFGGRVEPSHCGWCVGVHDYEIKSTHPWMDPALPQVSLINSNCDQVVAAPPDAEVLGTNGDIPVAMLRIGDNILTMQPHPEVTAGLMAEVYEFRRPDIGEAKAEQAISSLGRNAHSDQVAGWLANFLQR